MIYGKCRNAILPHRRDSDCNRAVGYSQQLQEQKAETSSADTTLLGGKKDFEPTAAGKDAERKR